MSDRMGERDNIPPFARTICSCDTCVECCHRPGHLIPADLQHFDEKDLVASAGALVRNALSGRTYRIGTITPKTKEDGSCVFLKDNRCTVHEKAPFGCAFFDPHMGSYEGHLRSTWGLHRIREDITAGGPYSKARDRMIIRDGGYKEPIPAVLAAEERRRQR